MNYVEYTVKYVTELIEFLKTSDYSQEDIHNAKIMLEIAEENKVDGFPEVYNTLNEKGNILWLHNFLKGNHEKPINILKPAFKDCEISSDIEEPLLSFLDKLAKIDYEINEDLPPLFEILLSFSKQLLSEHDENTAFVCLLRDTLLPFLALNKWVKRENVYPFLINRSFLNKYSAHRSEIYDKLHEAIFTVLDQDKKNFLPKVKNRIAGVLCKYPKLYSDLKSMLDEIKTKRIIVIETGYIGTIPLLLMTIDSRVEVRMFATAPYLYDVYETRIFTREFYKLRLFETLSCTDKLFKIGITPYKIIVNNDEKTINKAMKEITIWNKLVKKTIV